MRRQGLFKLHQGQDGVTAVIVALCLVGLMGMLVLVVDVGALLWKRREMVSGADAAALAAAKTCAVPTDIDGSDPKDQANTAAINNVGGLTASNLSDWQTSGCTQTFRTPRGYVTVTYSYPQQLFFAGIFGAKAQSVTTAATAAWGPLAGGQAVPIVLESSQFQGSCDVPDIPLGTTCSFWYDNGNAAIGDANWGFLNLDLWDVGRYSTDPNYQRCSSAGGSASRGDYILNDFGTDLTLAKPGPTYVCTMTGHATDNWQDLNDRMNGVGCKTSPCPGPVVLMPVNDCDQQIDKNGTIVPCGSGTPDKFAIIGFTTLELTQILNGNDTAAIGTLGTPAQNGNCGNNGTALGNAGIGDTTLDQSRQFGGWYLPTFADTSCGANGEPDIINTPVTVAPPTNKDPALVACTSVPATSGSPAPAPAGCDYYYNPSTKMLSWWNSASKNVDNTVKFSWTVSGTPASPGVCGIRSPDANAICLQMTWLGYSDQNGTVGEGPSFGTQGHVLCDFAYNSCPAGVKP
jgi:Flp pilus assembly protein TadG